jgi:tetratricopeptide (TPR) repeat protein
LPADLASAAADARTHALLGAGAYGRGEYDVAAECFRTAFALAPTHRAIAGGLAESLVAAGNYEEAEPLYAMMSELWPGDRIIRFNHAVVLSRLRRFAGAERVYRGLLSKDGTLVQARYNLASLLQAQGKLASARDQWQRVTADAPQLASAHAALGEVCIDLGQYESAMHACSRAARLDPNSVFAWRNMAVAARRAGSLGRSAIAARRAIALDGTDAEAWALLGQVYLDMHRRTQRDELLNQAVAAWRRSMEFDPNQPALREYLAIHAPPGDERGPVEAR